MKVIPSTTVTESMVVSTNVAEDDAPEYDALTTYATGERVILAAQHKVYESAIDSNLGNDPAAGNGTNWIEVYATKPWRVFDDTATAVVEQAGTISYTIAPQQLVRGVALIGVSALVATVKVLDGSDVVMATETMYLADYSEMVDALAMVLVEPKQKEIAVFEKVICQPGHKLEITIGNGSGQVGVREIVIGDSFTVGISQFGAEVGIDDYSDSSRDDYGNLTIVQRGYSDTVRIPVAVRTDDVARVKRRLTALRARYALYYFTADGNDFGTTIYGKFKSLKLNLSGPQYSEYDVEIEGIPA
jgi:hypothetical protein